MRGEGRERASGATATYNTASAKAPLPKISPSAPPSRASFWFPRP